MTAQQHAAAAGEVVAAAGAVSAVATLEAVEAAAAVSCFSGALEKRVELAVRGAAIVLHSLGERGERYRGAGEKEGGRYTRKGEFDKRSGSGGAATDGKGGKLWRHRHGT